MNKDFDGKHRNCHLQGKAVNHPVTTAEFAETSGNFVPLHGLIPKANIKH